MTGKGLKDVHVNSTAVSVPTAAAGWGEYEMCLHIWEVWGLVWMSFPCFISSNREVFDMHVPFLILPVNSKFFDGLKTQSRD